MCPNNDHPTQCLFSEETQVLTVVRAAPTPSTLSLCLSPPEGAGGADYSIATGLGLAAGNRVPALSAVDCGLELCPSQKVYHPSALRENHPEAANGHGAAEPPPPPPPPPPPASQNLGALNLQVGGGRDLTSTSPILKLGDRDGGVEGVIPGLGGSLMAAPTTAKVRHLFYCFL